MAGRGADRAGLRALDDVGRGALLAAVSGPLLVVYLLTASWGSTGSIDSFTNVLTARTLAVDGTVQLDDYEVLTDDAFVGRSAWVVEAADGPVSQYPPGAALHGVPAYLLFPGTTTEVLVAPIDQEGAEPVVVAMPPVAPAAATAALVTALAVGLLALTFRELAPGSTAWAAAMVVGLATSTWTVAADELWQHGPAMLWVAAAGLAGARARHGSASVAGAVAVVVRPLTAVILLGQPMALAVRRRWRAAATQAVGLGVGAAAIVTYNHEVFGSWSLAGGYAQTGLRPEPGVAWLAANVVKGFAHPQYGLLVWSPFLVPLAFGLRAAWRDAPDWVRGSAASGLAYLLLHWVLNRASGGEGYLYYRYPLEPLVAAAPLLLLAYLDGVRTSAVRTRRTHLLVLLAFLGHAVAALR